MPFDDERAQPLFDIEMGRMHCRVSPKPERYDRIRTAQAKAIVADGGSRGKNVTPG
jgi:hypothetical protein